MRFLSDIPIGISDLVPTEVNVALRTGLVELARLDMTDDAEVAELSKYCQERKRDALVLVEEDVDPSRAYVLLRPRGGVVLPGEPGFS